MIWGVEQLGIPLLHVMFCLTDHVMCFVCQQVFNEDAEDLDLDSLEGVVSRLQSRLSDHMIECHGVQMCTGVKKSETLSEESGSNADADTGNPSRLVYVFGNLTGGS